MTEPVRAATAELRVSYGQFFVRDYGSWVGDLSLAASNGLVGADSSGAVVLTGIHTGRVNVTVELLDSAPGSVDLDDWEEVVEVSVDSEDGELIACGLEDSPLEFPYLSHAGAGPYRLRVHARGRDTAPGLNRFEPVEDYKISVWPAPEAAETVYKQSDKYGQQVRTTWPRP
ncbi:hypothetical protein [Amycolatopsis taiwanensis]|uniref:Uncharacterized protein n=1 Tax=Amycolatopsis taiwanensis TaxID=342230 RepID=A0A9W6R1G0_9PSEU|nr:hypothetical protein [Amycolatopsis taiwanensis]GLY65847.1 hypothetical protein Atai01_24660 [Amycolatopsis taiwanensis]